jgi:hypothetical protein
MHTIKRKTEVLSDASKEVGLKAYVKIIICILMYLLQNAEQNRNIMTPKKILRTCKKRS